MIVNTISHKLHSLYTFAMVQVQFDSKSKFEAASNYMKQAYGPGIHHDRTVSHPAYNRNTGDNAVWYYSDNKKRWSNVKFYKIYLTTPEQMTMVSLLFN